MTAELNAATEAYATSGNEVDLKLCDALRREIERSARADGELAGPGMSPGGGSPV